jgi:hypothetical protein
MRILAVAANKDDAKLQAVKPSCFHYTHFCNTKTAMPTRQCGFTSAQNPEKHLKGVTWVNPNISRFFVAPL